MVERANGEGWKAEAGPTVVAGSSGRAGRSVVASSSWITSLIY